MDSELIGDIRSAASSMATMHELADIDAEGSANKIATLYVQDASKIWWWESLSVESRIIEYGETDGLKRIEEVVDGDAWVFLFVSDDEPRPWLAFEGQLTQVLEVISEQRFFEYMLADKTLEWVIFDTHHNSLVIAGRLIK